jgi:hypothetical protein
VITTDAARAEKNILFFLAMSLFKQMGTPRLAQNHVSHRGMVFVIYLQQNKKGESDGKNDENTLLFITT